MRRRDFLAAVSAIVAGPTVAKYLPAIEPVPSTEFWLHNLEMVPPISDGGFFVPPEFADAIGRIVARHEWNPPVTVYAGETLRITTTLEIGE